MRIAVVLLLACFAQFAALGAPPAEPITRVRFGGEAQIGSEPPIRVHVELTQEAQHLTGTFSSEDMALPFAGTRNGDVITGTLGVSEPVGKAKLELSASSATGEFTLQGQKGSLRLQRTVRDAKAFLRPPQSIELTAQQWNEDLDALVNILSSKHGNPFHHTPRRTFMREVEKVRHLLPRSAGIQNALHLRRLAALVGDGHTDVAFVLGRPVFPIDSFWFEDGLRLTAAPAGSAELLGSRVLTIGGIPTATILDRLKPFIGQAETPWGYRSAAPYLLYRADLLEAIGAARKGETEFVLRTSDGKLHRTLLKASSAKAEKVQLSDRGPLWQQRPGESFWYEQWPDGTTYVNWRSYDEVGVKAAALLSELDKNHPRRLLIDLRDNGGGDFKVGREVIQSIAKRPRLNRKGVLYVLVGRATFSAAMTNALDFRKLTNATLVGEPAGARPNGWQEVRRDFLPNSGLAVSFSTKYYRFLPGQELVRPEILVAPKIADWTSARDSAVDTILASTSPRS
jgi:hypothetical protein